MSEVVKVKEKLKNLPKEPGVYFFKNAKKQVIYVGKAAVLKNRVRQYFHPSTRLKPGSDLKARLLVEEIADVEWLVVGSEMEALFLESAMIKRYQPKYNILLRDDKYFLYIRVPIKDDYPVISFTRRPLDDEAKYFGPFTSAWAVRKAMRYLRKVFPYYISATQVHTKALDHHLGLSPPVATEADSKTYKKNLRQLMLYLEGKGGRVVKQLEKAMLNASKQRRYEEAAVLRNRLHNLKALSKQHLFGDKELFDLTRDQALTGLTELLGLEKIPRRMECYDISHLQGTHNTASMVVFSDGVPNRGEYRKFKMQLAGNDDYAHMREVLTRRFARLKDWPKPDLIIIDGGKGQLSAAISVLKELDLSVPAIGLAKREEEIVRLRSAEAGSRKQEVGKKINNPVSSLPSTDSTFDVIKLSRTSHTLKLLQHIRDEAHRFAVTYHSVLRSKHQTASILDDIPGVGPSTRKKLIAIFGSLRGVKSAELAQLQKAVGDKKAEVIKQYLS